MESRENRVLVTLVVELIFKGSVLNGCMTNINVSKEAMPALALRGPLGMKKHEGSPQSEGRHDHIGIKSNQKSSQVDLSYTRA